MKKFWIVLVSILVLIAIIFGLRLFVGGGEDTWICVEGQWVKHGNPKEPMPQTGCGESPPTTEETRLEESVPTSEEISEETSSGTEEPNTRETMTIVVYFGNTELNPNAQDCGKVYSVERTISKTKAVAKAALEQLFRGPTEEEKSQGYTSFFSDKTKSILKSVKIENRIAYVDLKDIRTVIPNANTSCGSADFFAEVGETLRQFPTIEKVIYAIEGDPEAFYEWMQIGCAEENNNCDPTPFQ